VIAVQKLTPGRQRSIAVGLLIAGMLLGATFTPPAPIRAGTVTLRTAELIHCEPSWILRRNLAAATVLWLGVATAGTMSVLSLLIVGGVVAMGAIRFAAMGVPPIVFLAGTVPHAVFEVGGFIWAGGAGLGGIKIAHMMLSKQPRTVSEIMPQLAQATRAYCVAAVCVAVGALAECYVTPVIFTYAARYVGML
jgi:uncharacterized membrane protein SpoIIM required for sporulation